MSYAQYNFGVLTAMTIIENAFCDFFRKFSQVASFASLATTSVPSTYFQSPFANNKWHIWNFHVIQFDLSSLSMDHFSSTDPAISKSLPAIQRWLATQSAWLSKLSFHDNSTQLSASYGILGEKLQLFFSEALGP